MEDTNDKHNLLNDNIYLLISELKYYSNETTAIDQLKCKTLLSMLRSSLNVYSMYYHKTFNDELKHEFNRLIEHLQHNKCISNCLNQIVKLNAQLIFHLIDSNYTFIYQYDQKYFNIELFKSYLYGYYVEYVNYIDNCVLKSIDTAYQTTINTSVDDQLKVI